MKLPPHGAKLGEAVRINPNRDRRLLGVVAGQVRAEHRLRQAELETLFLRGPFKEIGTSPSGRRYESLYDGKGNWTYKIVGAASLIVGTSVIEQDVHCIRTNATLMGRKYCGEVYRNPGGSPQTNDEYVRMNCLGKWRFSVKPLEKK